MSDEDDMRRDEDVLADIVQLHPDRDLEDDDAPLHEKPRGSYCSHRRVTLDEGLHRVLCRECEREVDPFAFLLTLTRDWARYVRSRKEAVRRYEAAVGRLDELLRLERNARARLRRLDPEAEASATKVPWGEGRTDNV